MPAPSIGYIARVRAFLAKERKSWADAWDARMTCDDAPAARPGGGWQPKFERAPAPPSGGTSATRARYAGDPPARAPKGGPIESRPLSPTLSQLPGCRIVRAGDSTWCEACSIRWDTNDGCPPVCPRRSVPIQQQVHGEPTPPLTSAHDVDAFTYKDPTYPGPRLQTLETASLEQLFGQVLKRLDPEPGRQGIAETPARAAKAWRYWCSGYGEDVDALFKSFEDGAEGYDEMVVVHNIPVLSHCEHHLAAISGIAHVGYIPNGRVVGLSKLARVVDALSRRLQVQERLTVQIADAIEGNLSPRGVGVIIKAGHGCMSSRGVRIHGSLTTTSALRGALHEGPARAEFLSLCAAAEAKASG